MLHVYVLDYTLGEIWHFTCSSDDDIESILEEHKVYPEDCYWLTSEEPLNVKELI